MTEKEKTQPFALQIEINEKKFQFTCDFDANIASVKEALFQFMKVVGNIEDQKRVEFEAIKQNEVEESKNE